MNDAKLAEVIDQLLRIERKLKDGPYSRVCEENKEKAEERVE
jgi:hypothetical protein